MKFDGELQLQPVHDSQDTMTAAVSFAFDNSYARLPEHFFARLAPTRMSAGKRT